MTETTDAPVANDQTEAAIDAFKLQLEGQISVSSSLVQDGLLEIWGLLPEGDTRTQIERWLTETLERHLYAVADVTSRLESVVGNRG